MRIFFIWFFGLFASAIGGAVIGDMMRPYDFGGFWGFFCGLACFTCARLTLAKPAR